MQGKNNSNSGLMEIRDLLKGEFNKFGHISSSLNQQKDNFGKIKDTLTSIIHFKVAYDGVIDHSANYINQLKKRLNFL
jgi:hypothetical protein